VSGVAKTQRERNRMLKLNAQGVTSIVRTSARSCPALPLEVQAWNVAEPTRNPYAALGDARDRQLRHDQF